MPYISVARQVWFDALHAEEIVAAHEQRIGVQDLRSRRRVVRVVEGQQGVAQERAPAGRATSFSFSGSPAAFSMAARRFSLRSLVDVLLGPVAEAHARSSRCRTATRAASWISLMRAG